MRRIRRKVTGRTKQEVRDKLKALHAELDAGIKSSPTYTVAEAVEDWLRGGLDGRSERTKKLYAGLMRSLMEHLGARPLRKLSATDVRWAMTQLAPRFSNRSLQITRNCLERAITHAQANDLVARNVAALATLPAGRAGRPSKSFTVEQARAVLAAAERTRMHAYVTLSLLVGLRSEEARALRWDHVVVWVDDAVGWQPVTEVGFDGARAGRTCSRSMCGVPIGTAGTRRRASPAGRSRCRAGAWTRSGRSRSGRRRIGCGRASCGRATAWYSRRGWARRWG